MAILIDNRQQHHACSKTTIEKTAKAVLDALACPEAELSVVLVDDPAIQELNRRYRGKDTPTNVLAFAMRDGAFGDLTPSLLGDVVMSMETVAREADAAGQSVGHRFNELLIHGILHLLGYDHETGDADAEIMEEKTGELLALVTAGEAPGA